MTIFTIYERQSYPSLDDEIESFETESEAMEYLRVIQKYVENPSDFYIRKEKETHTWLENADCFCYGDWID